MPTTNDPKLIAGNANRTLAKSVCRRLAMHRGVPVNLVDARVERFNDGEIFVEVYENVRGEDMFILQPTSRPANDNLMELLIITDALRRSSASRITAVIPYFGYARQDRRTKARTPISAKLVANLIAQAGIERVLTMDLHAAQIQGFFDIPVDNLYASPIFALDVKHHFEDMSDLLVISPDVGGVTRARELAQRLMCGFAIVDKRRPKPGEVAEMTVVGEVEGQRCIIIDDIVDTAGTLCKAAEVLIEHGAKEVHAYITHGVLSAPAVERVSKSLLSSLVISDTIEPTAEVKACANIRVVPTAPCSPRRSSTSGTAPACRRCSRPRRCRRSTRPITASGEAPSSPPQALPHPQEREAEGAPREEPGKGMRQARDGLAPGPAGRAAVDDGRMSAGQAMSAERFSASRLGRHPPDGTAAAMSGGAEPHVADLATYARLEEAGISMPSGCKPMPSCARRLCTG